MALADVSRLPHFARETAHRLGGRLREVELNQRFLLPVFGLGERLDDALRAPMRVWKLRQSDDSRAILSRAFIFTDPVPRAACIAALAGRALFDAVYESGLLVDSGENVVSPFRLDIAFDQYFFSDPLAEGGEAVMGPSATTGQLARGARPVQGAERALDLGCGAGVLAIALSDRADRVVATDINPRALAFTRLNAALNGVTNVEARAGDLFEPVRGEQFDLVVSQPPFVALPEEAGRPSFLFGGARGDELALRAISEVVAVLAPRGRALFLVDFPIIGASSPAVSVRTAMGGAGDLLLIESDERPLEDHCTLYSAGMHPTLGREFERTALAMRDHFQAHGVRGLSLSMVVIENGGVHGFTHTARVKPFALASPSSAHIGRMMHALSLLDRGVVAAGPCRFRFAPSVTFDPIPGAGVVIRLPGDSPSPAWGVDEQMVRELQLVGSAPDLFRALELSASPAETLKLVTEAVLRGALEVVP